MEREFEEVGHEASLAARRYNLVDPEKRHVVRELEARWTVAPERVTEVERRLADLEADTASRPKVGSAALMGLAHDLPAAGNAPTRDTRTKQRLTHLLIEEAVIDLDDAANEAVVIIHWIGGRHTELRVARVKTGRYRADHRPRPVDVMRKLGGHWPDRELSVTMNRMRCQSVDGETWTTVRVRELRERLGIAAFDPTTAGPETISVDETARRLEICVGSVHRLIRQGVLAARQLMASAPWKVPVAALETEAVQIGLREIIARRARNFSKRQDVKTLRLPGI